jgi:hypothetical protein
MSFCVIISVNLCALRASVVDLTTETHSARRNTESLCVFFSVNLCALRASVVKINHRVTEFTEKHGVTDRSFHLFSREIINRSK